MAVVDFSHAVLDVNGSEKPLTHSEYLALNNYMFYYGSMPVSDSSGSVSIITNTPTKVSLLYTGHFIESGTKFRIAYSSTGGTFEVSNISYSAGDTYSFIIDIEVEGNT